MKPVRLPPKVEKSFILPKKTPASEKELLRLSTLCLTSSASPKTTDALLLLEKSYALSTLSLISKNARDSGVRRLAREKHDNVYSIIA